jgi:hypothetical protein
MMWLGEYILPEMIVIVQSKNVTIHATFQEPIHHSAGHGSQALGSRDRGFESHSGHGCLVFVYVRFSVFVYR